MTVSDKVLDMSMSQNSFGMPNSSLPVKMGSIKFSNKIGMSEP